MAKSFDPLNGETGKSGHRELERDTKDKRKCECKCQLHRLKTSFPFHRNHSVNCVSLVTVVSGI
jgi:hypothetical protein